MKFTSLVISLLSVGLAHAQHSPEASSTTNLRGGGEKNGNTMDNISGQDQGQGQGQGLPDLVPNGRQMQESMLPDWELCASSDECMTGCCASAYDDGRFKCTPMDGAFRPDVCVTQHGPPEGATGSFTTGSMGSSNYTAASMTTSSFTTSATGTCGNGNRGDGICANGQCCSQYGWCGTTSAHCGASGTCGNGNRGNGICANGQCCSQYGWCGTTAAHCGTTTTTKLGDWAFCTSDSQCQNNCCSTQYSTSDGKLKCTPGGTICTGSSTGPSPSPPTSTPGTVLYQGSGWGTFFYDVTGRTCPGFSSFPENNGFPTCTSFDSAKSKQLHQYSTNNIIAIDSSILGADRAKYCGKEIVIQKDGVKVPGGPYVVFDGCAACQGGLGIDFSLSALNNIGNACNNGKIPGISWQVTTNQIIPFVP